MAIFVAYAIWMGVTFAVLLCMDVLECFLHALRLHWVSQQRFLPVSVHCSDAHAACIALTGGVPKQVLQG